MPTYLVNGHKVSFANEPSEADIDEAASQLGPKMQFSNTEEANTAQNQAQKDLRIAQFNTNPLAVASNTVSGMESTVVNSGKNFAGGVLQAATHIPDTVRGLVGTAAGGIEKLIPGQQPQEPYFDAAVQGVKDRYGSPQKAFNTAGSDPVGFLADASVVAGGAGAALGRIPIGVTNVGRIASKVGIEGDFLKNAGEFQAMEKKLGNIDTSASGQAVDTSSRGAIDYAKSNAGKTIYALYNESVGAKPKNSGTDLDRFRSDRVNAIQTISNNLDSIEYKDPFTGEVEKGVPQNRLQLAQALYQAKQAVWKKVSDLSSGATDAGVKINVPALADQALSDAKASIGEAALKSDPSLLASLESTANKIKLIGEASPTDVQTYMKFLNEQVQQLRQSGDGTAYSTKELYSKLLPRLSENMDSSIEKALDKPEYSAYRKQYSSLRSAEKEVFSSGKKYERSQSGNAGGITHPLVNLWSLEELLSGGAKALTGNVVGATKDVGRAALIKGASKLLDHFSNPDRKISKMFEIAQKYPDVKSPSYSNPAINMLREYSNSSNPRKLPLPTTQGLPAPQVVPQYLKDRQNIPVIDYGTPPKETMDYAKMRRAQMLRTKLELQKFNDAQEARKAARLQAYVDKVKKNPPVR